MKQFSDATQRQWPLVINVSAVKRVRDLTGVDLPGLLSTGGDQLNELLDDPVRTVNVLYVLCQEDAKSRAVSDEEFGRLMYGDTLGSAMDAMVEELIDFFPPRRRGLLREVVAKGRAVAEAVVAAARAELDAIDPAEAARKLIGSAGNSPGPSASTPAPSPSANS